MPHRNLFVFDIETVPDTDAVVNLTGFTDPDPAARRKELERYHLDVTDGRNSFPRQPFHRVVAIGFLDAEIEREGGGEIYHLRDLRSGGEETSGERDLIQGFFAYLKRKRPRLVSFNGRGFDLSVLKYRAMVHGIGARFLYTDGDKWNSYTSRYSEDWHCDLLEVMSEYGGSARIRLDEACSVFGFPGKFGMDGSDVTEMVENGRIGEVRDYCETDVLNTYLVYLRLMHHRGTISTEGYNRAIADIIALIEAEGETRPHLAAFMDAWGEASGHDFML